MMRRLIKRILRRIYLEEFAKDLLLSLWRTRCAISWHVKRDLAGTDRKLIEGYYREHRIRKLHIGCGQNDHRGWLNSDYYPQSAQILHLDATEQFPFGNDEFDYVFSEHMIEHITYSQGLHMLAECHRVLKPNGKVRITTPDLSFLIDLYGSDKSDLQNDYIEWATNQFISAAPRYEDTFVINNFVRDWGHKFIYDEKALRGSMEKAAFTGIVRRHLNDSQDDELRDLENEGRMPEGFLRLESLVLEGTKPFPHAS
jgi:predicted SAM-dependent methyltransferase